MPSEPARVTIRDIADTAGTSIGSVSVALRGAKGVGEQTRRRILQIADELGYVPDQRAQTLRRHSNKLIGVVFSLEQSFHADLVESLYAEATHLGYDLSLSGTTRSRTDRDAVQSLLRERVDAVVFLAQDSDSPPWLRSPLGAPIVTIGHHDAAPGLIRIVTDDASGMRQSLLHLKDLGHRQAVYLDGGSHPAGRHRLDAAQKAAGDAGMQLIVHRSGPTEADGIAAGQSLVETVNLPTAVLCFNDLNAMGLLAYMHSAGTTVPDEVSIIGYDDARISRLSLAQLTTVRQDRQALASMAIDEAIGCAEHGAPPQSPMRVAQPELIIRHSTGPKTSTGRAA